ncbi:MAG: colicin import membrane protein [Cellvibrionaceae bacterium]|jgi:colicin import membrane protein
MTSYWPAIFFSLLMHGAALWLLGEDWQQKPKENIINPPAYIKATLIDLQSQSKPVAPKQAPKLEKKQQRDIPSQQQLKKQAEEDARRNRAAEQKAAKERSQAQRKKLEKEQKLAAQKKLKEQQEFEEQRRLERETLRQQAEQQRFQENMVRELARLQAEQQAERLAQQAEEDAALAKSYSLLIKKRVESNWSRPPTARRDMETTLRIQLVPTGEVIDVLITKSSGNKAFDNSAIRAVKKARQFSKLQGMPTRVFEKNFRQFQLEFKPQDLRQ